MVPRTPEVEEGVDRLNQEFLARVEQRGKAFLSNAVVNGRFALRACIVNFRTSRQDVDALLPLVAQLGREADGTPM
jgi:aromatic-L-amino-acid/L-tryptophan decarboxylase